MTAYRMFQVDAFADALFKGNPAAVLVVEAPLPDNLMQAIAQENNLAETAFVTRAGADWHIRWFTPLHEAAFCGHAALATAHVLCTEYSVDLPIRFTTGAVGALQVSLPTAEAVRCYQPDLCAISQLHPLGLVITAAGGKTHGGCPIDFTSRYFAPGAGIDEDPVTGSIHATLVPYWGDRLKKAIFWPFRRPCAAEH